MADDRVDSERRQSVQLGWLGPTQDLLDVVFGGRQVDFEANDVGPDDLRGAREDHFAAHQVDLDLLVADGLQGRDGLVRLTSRARGFMMLDWI